MKRLYLFMILLSSFSSRAQLPDEMQPEPQSEERGDPASVASYEDDIMEGQMQEWEAHPLDLNDATETDLYRLGLQPLQVESLLRYRRYCNAFIDIHELQSVPHFHPDLIRKIRPYISVRPSWMVEKKLTGVLRSGKHRLTVFSGGSLPYLFRREQDYEGTGNRLLAAYRFQYQDKIRASLLGEKDAGESFFRKRQRIGFDFYSGNLMLSGIRKIQTIILGDFSVNIGQGLIHWQGLSLGKSADITAVIKNSPVLKPYQSSGESNFHRGIGMTIAGTRWQLTAFLSQRWYDASLDTGVADASLITVSSLRTNGYHRNASEWSDRAAYRRSTMGMVLRNRFRGLRWGLNAVHHVGSLSETPSSEMRRLFTSYKPGRYQTMASIDWAVTARNVHFFGEAAIDWSGNKAITGGAMASISSHAEASLLYRAFGVGYAADPAFAFSEFAGVGNERGFFAGVCVRPVSGLSISGYTDQFTNPWIRYRQSRPFRGYDYFLEGRYNISKQSMFYFRYRKSSKGQDTEIGNGNMAAPIPLIQRSYRWGLEHHPFPGWRLRLQSELKCVESGVGWPGSGQYLLLEVNYKPLMSPFSALCRVVSYKTDDWQSRLYIMERGLLPGFTALALYGSGYRCQFMATYKYSKKWKFAFSMHKTLLIDNHIVKYESDLQSISVHAMISYEIDP